MKISLFGKRWNLRFTTLRNNRGEIDSPKMKGKEIRIDSRLEGEEELEVLIHEMLHGAYWFIDEEYVDRAAKDIANALWRLNYRKLVD